MFRATPFCILLLITIASFGQELNSHASPLNYERTTDSAGNEGFYLSLDTANNKLIITPGSDSIKLFGIKIFTEEGEELFSRRVNDSSKPIEIDITDFAEGDYIIHLVTEEQYVYRAKFAYRR